MPENLLLSYNSQVKYPPSRLEIESKQLPYVMNDHASPIIKDKLHKSMIAGKGGIL